MSYALYPRVDALSIFTSKYSPSTNSDKTMKKLDYYYNVQQIIDSLVNGQYRQAKEYAQHGRKTKPEAQARIVGQVVGALCDRASDNYDPDLAVVFLNMFNH